MIVQPVSPPVQLAASRNSGEGNPPQVDRKKYLTLGAISPQAPDPSKTRPEEIFQKINNKPPGRPRAIASPYQILERFVLYAKFIDQHPLQEEKIFTYRDKVVRAVLRKARPLTISGFCTFLCVTPQAWRYWRKHRGDLSDAVELIENAIYAHKFEGAAAGIFKANIISRELGGIKQA